MSLRPPGLALKLIEHFVPDHEILAGDLMEEFDRRRSRPWFWWQAIAAVFVAQTTAAGQIRPLRLVQEPSAPPAEPRPGRRRVAPVGGVGLLAIVLLVGWAQPAAWWVVAVAVPAGAVLGAAMIVIQRHRLSSPRGGTLHQSWREMAANDRDRPR